MNKKLLCILSLLLLSGAAPVLAQGPPKAPSALENPVAQLLLAVIFGLFIAIAVLGNVVVQAVDIYRERMKKSAGKTLLVAGIIIAGCLFSSTGMAQDNAPQVTMPQTINGLSSTAFYALTSVIALELLVLLVLLYALRTLAGIESKRKRKQQSAVAGKPAVSWWERLNKTRTVTPEAELSEDMGHDFDGIRELNNPTPPWWKWAFYFSIFFGIAYLWVYHVAHSAPSQLEELANAEARAAAEKEAYLANAANNIDEHSVKLLTDAADLTSGQKLFSANCAPCHGAAGQGVVGPNLTDNYWLHGGKINEVFSTIKYGVPEKGMKSWKDDFSPKQLAQLASFIKSIHDTHPAGAKEPQGVPEN
jgi:cytochrome c oxidase cbb3-type subunit 3